MMCVDLTKSIATYMPHQSNIINHKFVTSVHDISSGNRGTEDFVIMYSFSGT